jgi:hypothetical protein
LEHGLQQGPDRAVGQPSQEAIMRNRREGRCHGGLTAAHGDRRHDRDPS